jgi:DNA-binding response OmpR family regulator
LEPRQAPAGNALLVGPSLGFNDWVATVADSAGFSVTTAYCVDVLWSVMPGSADVVLVEAQREHRNAVIAAIEGSALPTRRRIVLLTWQLHWETIQRALNLEVADFQPMPCRSEELASRMRAASVRAATRERVYDAFDPGEPISAASASLRRPASLLGLTSRERAVYRVLAMHEGKVVSRAHLLAAVWSKDGGTPATSNVVDVYVRYLRVKLAKAMPEVSVETVKRAGYVLCRKAVVAES